ncbi:MAG TPA: prepilin-type N-terminal cleavage/methylation domain-containing protein [Chthoniobacterales bacterium]|jgi:prepilin-type N-terminal cleavage/methylation domain-containing protein
MLSPANAGSRSRLRAFSLPEMVVVIALIGILAAIAIQGFSGTSTAARETVARDNLQLLNRGLLHFNQTNWDVVLNRNDSSTADELAILRTLQWRNPDPSTPGAPGAPYVPQNFSDTTSSSTDDYRIQWNGYAFELIRPGTVGMGLLTGERNPGSASSYSFPSDYQPLGPNQHE